MKVGMRYKVNVGAVVFTTAVCFTIIISGFIYLWAQSITSSPEIFFHTDEVVTFDLAVRIEDGITKTVPSVEMGKEAVWKDLTVYPDGMVEHEGKRYPFLYYEGVFIDRYPLSETGWVISETEDGFTVNGELHTSESLNSVLTDLFMDSGLTAYESSIMLIRMRSLGVFEKEGDIVLRYIPQEDVDNIIRISSSVPMEMMRRHFLVEVTDDLVLLEDPLFDGSDGCSLIMHETALNYLC